ncbi:LamG domain-containing protein [Candidatus Poribacteria bacterium]|nr:LamG domain-containing protein [Candidatus Poribacteria bacterium]
MRNKSTLVGVLAAFALAIMASTSHATLADGRILYLPFDEGADNTAADLSGNNAKGTINGAKWTGGASCAEIGLYLAGAWVWLRTVEPLEKAKFHHIVAVCDLKNGLHIYYDGKLDDGAGSAGAKPAKIDPAPGENLGIGHNYNLAGRFWVGVIDEVAVYNRALSEAEVAQLYKTPPMAQGIAPKGKLAAIWSQMKARR